VTDLVEEVEGRARIADAQPRRLNLPHPYSHPHTHRCSSSCQSSLESPLLSLWWSTSLPPLPLRLAPSAFQLDDSLAVA